MLFTYRNEPLREMKHYSIKDLEKYSGIKAHTIRIWEKRYGLIEPLRTGTNIRYYSSNDLKHILNISMLNRHGYRISAIAKMSPEQMAETITKLGSKKCEYERYIDDLVAAMLDFDQPRFGRILSKLIHHMGFDDTYREIILPFFNRIGILWQSGSISLLQEHFVSNIIRQKVYAAIEKNSQSEMHSGKTYLLLLPSNEYHEFGVLYLYYLLAKKGHSVIYLGQNTPFNEISSAVLPSTIDCVVTSFTTPLPEDELIENINLLAGTFTGKPVYISGLALGNLMLKLPEKVSLIPNLSEFPLS